MTSRTDGLEIDGAGYVSWIVCPAHACGDGHRDRRRYLRSSSSYAVRQQKSTLQEQLSSATGVVQTKVVSSLIYSFGINSITQENHLHGAQYNFKVQYKRCILSVPDIKNAFVGRRNDPPSIYLCPTSYAGSHGQASSIIWRLIARQQRTRTDKRHVSDQHVIELRQLIKPGTSYYLPYSRRTLIIGDAPLVSVVWRPHCPKFV